MAVPTISAVSPATGAPTGGQSVQITGTGYRLPSPPGEAMPAPPSPASVRVMFGGVASPEVSVISATRLLARTPKRALPVSSGGVTAPSEIVDVIVQNIDDAGVLIPGETVTAPAVYTYTRPIIAHTVGANYVFARAIAQLVSLLRSEVHANVVLDTSADYDPATGTWKIEAEALPQIILTGPTISTNTLHTYRGSYLVPTADPDESLRRRRHRIYDLTFEVICVTGSTRQGLHLCELLSTVLDRNQTLEFAHAPGQLALLEITQTGEFAYERDMETLMSDLRVYRGSIVLAKVPVTTLPGVDQDAIVDGGASITDILLDAATQIGETYDIISGAPTRSVGEAPLPSLNSRAHGQPTLSPPPTGSPTLTPRPTSPTRSPGESYVNPSVPPHGAPTRSPPDAGVSHD